MPPKVFHLYRSTDKVRLYEEVFRRPLKRWQTYLTEGAIDRLSPPPASGYVLDLPCGNGRLRDILTPSDGFYVGADISREMLDAARRSAPPGPGRRAYVQCDARHLPFRPASFDRVACIRFFVHLPSELRVRILTELRQVARIDFIVSYPHRYHVKYLSRLLRAKLGRPVRLERMLTRGQILEEVRAARCVWIAKATAVPWLSTTWVLHLRPAILPAIRDLPQHGRIGLDGLAARPRKPESWNVATKL